MKGWPKCLFKLSLEKVPYSGVSINFEIVKQYLIFLILSWMWKESNIGRKSKNLKIKNSFNYPLNGKRTTEKEQVKLVQSQLILPMYTKNFVAQSVPTLLNLECYQVKSIRSKGALYLLQSQFQIQQLKKEECLLTLFINTVSPQPVVTRTVDQSNSLTLPLARSLTKNSNKIVLQVS